MTKTKRKIKNCYKEENRFTAEYHAQLRKEAKERADRWTAKRAGRFPYEAFIAFIAVLVFLFWALGRIGGLF